MKRKSETASSVNWQMSASDQQKGLPMPPIQKPAAGGGKVIRLPQPPESPGKKALAKAISGRKSRRQFSDEHISQEELSFLLWASQGVRDASNPNRIYRNVPSAGNRHALETYLAVFRVEGLEKGIYRYLPLDHALVLESTTPDLETLVSEACMGQAFAGSSAATFIWAVVKYRMEWRYPGASIKLYSLDAGHACQNLYLACEATGCGTCAIAAYDQDLADRLLGLDGEKEFVIYIAPVGKAKD